MVGSEFSVKNGKMDKKNDDYPLLIVFLKNKPFSK